MELIAPAGSMASAHAALEEGADAIYLGVTDLSHQRDQCKNFSDEELRRVIALARRRGAGVLVTFNSSYNQRDFDSILDKIDTLAAAGAQGVILADLGLIAEVRRRHPGLAVHYSVQGQCSNIESARVLAELGVDRVVLDRNVSVAEAAEVRRAGLVEVEMFVFGFQCYSQDSICYMGDYWSGMPCKVHCTGRVRMSSRPRLGRARRELFMHYYSGLDYLPQMAAAGVSAVKLEGRHRSADYTRRITRVFRQALDELQRCQGRGEPFVVRRRWRRQLGIAALGFPVTRGFFVHGDYQRRVIAGPGLRPRLLFVADTVRTLLETGNLRTFRDELSSAWQRYRATPARGRGAQNRNVEGLD